MRADALYRMSVIGCVAVMLSVSVMFHLWSIAHPKYQYVHILSEESQLIYGTVRLVESLISPILGVCSIHTVSKFLVLQINSTYLRPHTIREHDFGRVTSAVNVTTMCCYS